MSPDVDPGPDKFLVCLGQEDVEERRGASELFTMLVDSTTKTSECRALNALTVSQKVNISS